VAYNVLEWLNLVFRWAHVFSAILWVGSTYYFTWLDGQMKKHADAPVWMVHSGGFYTVTKQKSLGVAPRDVHWFRWEALATFVTGFALLHVVYYDGGLMVDPISAKVTTVHASMIGVGTLVVGWIVYDTLARTPLVENDIAFALVGFLLIVGTAVALSMLFSSRATYIHVGALFGTIMVSNVWMRILPPQRRMIAAAVRGEAFSEAAGAGPKRRSKHNTFLAVPTTFIMISNHFPTATYGNHYAVPILGALILVGWAAAGILRRA
jgi:uncharacterized membrane protein